MQFSSPLFFEIVFATFLLVEYILLINKLLAHENLRSHTSLAFWLGRLAFVSDGVSNNGRLEAERPPTSVGPPSGGWAATFVSFV